ncbi:MAG: carboxypeptidase-like regulatory domain-containing protein, partial [Bacteroidia bacterium]
MRKLLSLIFISLLSFAAYAQQKDLAVVYGTVKDSLGRSFADANVFVVGTNITTTSREDGSYQLKIPANKELELVFSFVGRPSYKATVGPLKVNERFL